MGPAQNENQTPEEGSQAEEEVSADSDANPEDMTEQAVVAAEDLKDAVASTEGTSNDEATASADNSQEILNVTVAADGELFLKVESGASGLTASAVAFLACSYIIN